MTEREGELREGEGAGELREKELKYRVERQRES